MLTLRPSINLEQEIKSAVRVKVSCISRSYLLLALINTQHAAETSEMQTTTKEGGKAAGTTSKVGLQLLVRFLVAVASIGLQSLNLHSRPWTLIC